MFFVLRPYLLCTESKPGSQTHTAGASFKTPWHISDHEHAAKIVESLFGTVYVISDSGSCGAMRREARNARSGKFLVVAPGRASRLGIFANFRLQIFAAGVHVAAAQFLHFQVPFLHSHSCVLLGVFEFRVCKYWPAPCASLVWWWPEAPGLGRVFRECSERSKCLMDVRRTLHCEYLQLAGCKYLIFACKC